MSVSDTASRTSTGRIATLDVLRGLAILGTFASNVWLFADPGGPGGWLSSGFGGAAGAPGVLETFLRFLANGKFLALLTLLFGIGLELQYRAAVRRGLRWPGRYVWRATILFVEGLVHYVLVFEFDVLMGYAITSVLVAYLVGRSDRVVTAAMAVGATLTVMLVGMLTAFPVTGTGGPAPLPPIGYLEQVANRLQEWMQYRIEIVLIVPSGTVLFLLGMRLLRAGAFESSPSGARLRRRMTVIGLVGLPLNLLTSFAGPRWFFVDRYLCAPLVAIGVVAVVTTLMLGARGPEGPIRRGLTAVGRTALSCYVLQNVAASVLCYSWGLGLAAVMATAGGWAQVLWVPLLWAVVCVALTVVATVWLRRFERGPLEKVMHRAMGTSRRSGQ